MCIRDSCFVVENLKIVQGSKGLFLGMPSQPDGKGGYRDMAYPVTCLLYTSHNQSGAGCSGSFQTQNIPSRFTHSMISNLLPGLNALVIAPSMNSFKAS